MDTCERTVGEVDIEAMQAAVYRRRRSAVSRGEREWRVEDDALVSCGAASGERRYPWKDFISVRLCHAPTRRKPWRYVFVLQRKQGHKIEIDNAHYLTFGAFEDRSRSYAPFVRAALARLAEKNPKARALIGETPTRYFLLLLAALLVLGGAAFALAVLPTPTDAPPYAGLAKLALILLMLPVFWRWIIGAMPRGVALDAIPDRALPPEQQ